MNKHLTKHIFRFFLFVVIQILILNNIFFWGYINPYAYIIFICLLPISISKNNLLLLAFLLGISIDMFQDSMGTHAFACVLIAFLRLNILQLIIPQIKNKHQGTTELSIHEFGFQTVLIYTTILTIIHHFILFSLELLRFDLLHILARTITSSFFTIIMIIIFQYLFLKNSNR